MLRHLQEQCMDPWFICFTCGGIQRWSWSPTVRYWNAVVRWSPWHKSWPTMSHWCKETIPSIQGLEVAKLHMIIWHHNDMSIWMFPKVGTPKWMIYSIMENPIKMDDLGVPLFLETPIWTSSNIFCGVISMTAKTVWSNRLLLSCRLGLCVERSETKGELCMPGEDFSYPISFTPSDDWWPLLLRKKSVNIIQPCAQKLKIYTKISEHMWAHHP